MRSMTPATFVLAAALAAGGCAATVTADAYPPDLVYVSPGVQVIADYNEPIFYSDGLYWRYYGGVWYRSTYYTGGWVYARPPVAVLRVDRPAGYVHYRPAGWAGRPRNAPPPGHAGWRGNPAPAPAPAAGWRGGPAPAPAGGWRGGPAPAPAAARAPVGGGWRSGPVGGPPPAAHGAPPPPSPHSAPAPARGAPPKAGGWRNH